MAGALSRQQWHICAILFNGEVPIGAKDAAAIHAREENPVLVVHQGSSHSIKMVINQTDNPIYLFLHNFIQDGSESRE